MDLERRSGAERAPNTPLRPLGRVVRELVVPHASFTAAGLLLLDDPTEYLLALGRPIVALELRTLADLLVVPRMAPLTGCYDVDRQTSARTLRTRADEL